MRERRVNVEMRWERTRRGRKGERRIEVEEGGEIHREEGNEEEEKIIRGGERNG